MGWVRCHSGLRSVNDDHPQLHQTSPRSNFSLDLEWNLHRAVEGVRVLGWDGRWEHWLGSPLTDSPIHLVRWVSKY